MDLAHSWELGREAQVASLPLLARNIDCLVNFMALCWNREIYKATWLAWRSQGSWTLIPGGNKPRVASPCFQQGIGRREASGGYPRTPGGKSGAGEGERGWGTCQEPRSLWGSWAPGRELLVELRDWALSSPHYPF